MSKMSDVILSIQDEIRLGVLSFKEIAKLHKVTQHFVNQVWEEMCAAEFAE